MEMDGTFLILFVQCFLGVASLLAKQATQLIMVSGECELACKQDLTSTL